MENKKAIEISEKLDNIKLFRIRKYMLGRTLCAANIVYYNGEVNWKTCIHLLLQSCYEVKYFYGEFGRGDKICFLFSSHNSGREDHRETFHKITSTCKSRIELVFDRISKSKIGLKNVFRLLLLPIWYFQLQTLPISKLHRMYLLAKLFLALSEKEAIEEKIPWGNCCLFTCYFDGAAVESLVVQDLNMLGYKTATLQHGHFYPNGFAFYASTSQIFLALSNYEKQLAIKSGIKAQEIVVLGMGKYIGQQQKEEICPSKVKNIVGIVFDGDDYYDNNIEMLKVVKQFAECMNFKILVKLHPTSKNNLYEKYIDKKLIYSTDTNMSASRFMEEVEFIVLANSTILLEAIYLLKEWYRYCNRENDVFDGIDYGKFSSFNELMQEYKLKNTFDKGKEIRNYIIGSKNPESAYEEFFEKRFF